VFFGIDIFCKIDPIFLFATIPIVVIVGLGMWQLDILCQRYKHNSLHLKAKETAKNSIVIQIVAKGKSYERSQLLNEKIIASGAHIITVEELESDENFSVLHNIVPFNFMSYYLALKLGIEEFFKADISVFNSNIKNLKEELSWKVFAEEILEFSKTI
jgi:hypothetical protein